LAIRLIGWRRIDNGPGLSSALIVRIDIVDKHHETSWLGQKGPGRGQPVLRVNAVKPDNGAAGGYFGMDSPATVITFQYSGLEPERLH
jgi:hypothetical protein